MIVMDGMLQIICKRRDGVHDNLPLGCCPFDVLERDTEQGIQMILEIVQKQQLPLRHPKLGFPVADPRIKARFIALVMDQFLGLPDFCRQLLHNFLVFLKIRIPIEEDRAEGVFEQASGTRADAVDAFQNVGAVVGREDEHIDRGRHQQADCCRPQADEERNQHMVVDDFHHRDGG